MDSKQQPERGRQPPPPLPPRQQSSTSTSPSPYYPNDAPPSYDSINNNQTNNKTSPYTTWQAQSDPRSSSTQSLTPSDDNNAEDLQHRPQSDRRRKLLCIYVHGFMGNETSFRSFPAHVHNLLAVLLGASHAVHTKVYPRYRSRQNITVARDDFSRWLAPHEGDNTDVVLLGHSMGGLVCAEVALLFKHRIVGTVNFDVPFLGMHPGVIKSGLASIFTAAPEEPTDNWEDTQMASEGGGGNGEGQGFSGHNADGFWRPEKKDPNFNPAFQNDKILPMRSGWRGAWHFISKHSNDLGQATKQLVTSHMEFGGAMANYPELKARYARLRALEEQDPQVRRSVSEDGTPPRIRFVNYYTASTGRPKKPKQEDVPGGVGDGASLEVVENPMPNNAADKGRSPSPSITLEEHDQDGHVKGKQIEVPSDEEGIASSPEMRHVDPSPVEEHSEEPVDTPTLSPSSTRTPSMTSSLPPIPDEPTPPSPLDVSYIEDNQTKKLVEKEHSRALKNYERAVKERDRIIRDRARLEEKRERREKKESSKAEKEAQKARAKAEKEDGKQVKKMAKAAELGVEAKVEITHEQREEKRLAEERERMAREERRMRGEPEPEAKEQQQQEVVAEETSPTPPQSMPPTIASSSSPPPELQAQPSTNTPVDKEDKKDKSKKDKKPPKDRKFCTLPPKDSQGQRDPCWPRVFMKDVDEVGAHCGLFFVDERYERLVGDVAERIEEWVKAEGGIEGGLERMRLKG